MSKLVERVARAALKEVRCVRALRWQLDEMFDIEGEEEVEKLERAVGRAAIAEVLSALEEPSEAVAKAYKDAAKHECGRWAVKAWNAALSQFSKEIEG